MAGSQLEAVQKAAGISLDEIAVAPGGEYSKAKKSKPRVVKAKKEVRRRPRKFMRAPKADTPGQKAVIEFAHLIKGHLPSRYPEWDYVWQFVVSDDEEDEKPSKQKKEEEMPTLDSEEQKRVFTAPRSTPLPPVSVHGGGRRPPATNLSPLPATFLSIPAQLGGSAMGQQQQGAAPTNDGSALFSQSNSRQLTELELGAGRVPGVGWRLTQRSTLPMGAHNISAESRARILEQTGTQNDPVGADHAVNLNFAREQLAAEIWTALDLVLGQIREMPGAAGSMTFDELVFDINHRSRLAMWVAQWINVNIILAGGRWARKEIPKYSEGLMNHAKAYFRNL